MNDFLKKYGQWGLVAGAAEGLGEAWSRVLAGKKMNVVMVDHNLETMEKLAAELEKTAGIKVLKLHLDLASDDAMERMVDAVKDIDCRLMIYNAAYSRVQPFLKNTLDDLDHYVAINTRTLIKTAHSFAAKCKQEGGGGMIFMSSLAGLWGTQLLGPYGATKAFAYVLAEALNHELKPDRIDVMACIAGATATPAYLGTKPKYGWPKPSVMDPVDVARKALDRLGRKVLFIPGFSNRMTYVLFSRIFSRKFARRMFNLTTGKMYREKF